VTHAPSRNPLTLPLIAVSAVAVLEAILLGVLLLQREQPAGAVTAQAPVAVNAPSAAPAAPAATPATANVPAKSEAPPRGKVGERVESAGFGITVEKLLTEPQTYKDQVRVGPEQRYLAMLLRIDNNTGGNAQLFPSQFTLKDEQGFAYEQLGIHGTMPVLEWRTMANRETARGHVDFVVPKSAKGLMLLYSDVSHGNGAQPIQIDLGQ
jgi:hypothetical protein